MILGIITQRPVELSDNVISQCTNFLIFKINHPMDIDYMRKMIPHITDEIIEKQKSLQSGTCLGFGLGFKIPLIIKMKMPDPAPLSGNCDVVNIWCGVQNGGVEQMVSVSQIPAQISVQAPVQASNQALFQMPTQVVSSSENNNISPSINVGVPEITKSSNENITFANNPVVIDSIASSVQQQDVSMPKLEEASAPVGLSEIIDINVGQQGMGGTGMATLTTDSGEPLLKLVEQE